MVRRDMVWRGKLGHGEARWVTTVLVGSCVLRLGKARQGVLRRLGYGRFGHGRFGSDMAVTVRWVTACLVPVRSGEARHGG